MGMTAPVNYHTVLEDRENTHRDNLWINYL